MIRIITDSTSSITQEDAKKMNIDVVPLYVLIDDKIYKDRVDFSDNEFYALLKEHQPTTSQPNPVDFLAVYDKYPDDEIICITSSLKISGTNQSANIAKSMSDNENITVINSENISLGLRNIVIKAVELRDAGCDYKTLVDEINDWKGKSITIGMADKLDNLKRGGRISHVEFFAANVLSIKPMVIVKDGLLESYHKKARGRQKAINILLDSLNELNYDPDSNIIVGYTENIENAKLLSDKLEGINLSIYNKGNFYDAGAVIATHTGEGAIILSFFVK